MKFKRTDRVSDLIQQEISDILLKEVNDPRIGFVTITEVRLSDDLRNARVFASVLGDEKAKANSMAGLRSATPYIQREVGRRIRLKVTPELYFSLDESAERGAKIDTLLNQIHQEEQAKAKKETE